MRIYISSIFQIGQNRLLWKLQMIVQNLFIWAQNAPKDSLLPQTAMQNQLMRPNCTHEELALQTAMQNKFIRVQNATKDIPSFYIPKRCQFKLFSYFSFFATLFVFFLNSLCVPIISQKLLRKKKHHKPNMQLYEPLIKLILSVTKLSNLMQSMKSKSIRVFDVEWKSWINKCTQFPIYDTYLVLFTFKIHSSLIQIFHSFQVLIDTINVVFTQPFRT